MGIHVIKMPDIGEGIAEVELVGWHVKVGDTVAEDQPLADVMTDKATVEIPSPVVGRVVALGGDVGQVMAVGGELIRLEVEGEGNLKADAAQKPQAAAVSTAAPAAVSAAAPKADKAPAGGVAGQIAASLQAAAPAASTAATPSHASAPQGQGRSGAARQAPAAVRQPGEKPLASPAVRKRAWDLGIELRLSLIHI